MSANNEKGSSIPLRPRPEHSANNSPLSDKEREAAQQEVIDKAPLRSTEAESTNKQAKEETKPWRTGIDLPVEALMQIRKKTSINQAMELELRLAYLMNEKNSKRGFGPKVYVNDLINEAIEQYTRSELKKLGYDTK